MIDRAIGGDAIQPRREAEFRVEAGQREVDLEENLLREVERDFEVGHHQLASSGRGRGDHAMRRALSLHAHVDVDGGGIHTLPVGPATLLAGPLRGSDPPASDEKLSRSAGAPASMAARPRRSARWRSFRP